MTGFRATVLISLFAAALPALAAERCATDALNQTLCPAQPAGRIVSLSPGATELVFAAGAGDELLAVSAWSDYPDAARELPQVGDAHRLDLEAILALQPDLVVAWVDGNDRAQLSKLSDLGVPVFWLEPRDFDDIPAAVEAIGQLAGTHNRAKEEAARFRDRLASLRERYADAQPIRVFYQVWDQPLMTINREELIGKAIALCGGDNVFGGLPRLVPRISREAVINAAPEVILTSGRADAERNWLDDWRAFQSLPAVAAGNLFLEPPDLLARPTPRMLEGVAHLCQSLETARGRL